MDQSSRADTFSGRVLVVFGTQVFGAGVGIINGILLARLLGPAAKGEYYFLVLLPATTITLLQLGLPQAFGYFAARGQTIGMVGKSIVLAVILSLVALIALFALLPILSGIFPPGIGIEQILFAFLALPLALNATFTTGIVTGRQAVRWYAGINMAYPIISTVLLVVILGGLGGSVNGAIAVYVIVASIQSLGFAIGARWVGTHNPEPAPVSYRDLLRYGLPYYPGSITQFFSARADVFLIAWLVANAAAPLGYYSMAVGLAELVFYFPNAVATLFFPHVAGASREESDSQVTMVTRVSLLITAAVALALAPAAVLMIQLLLPAFVPSLPALFLLLPGVVALSATRVVYVYLTGIGKPALTSYVNVFAFALNIVLNIYLIPRFGIEGAAVASLVSYSVSAILLTTVAARLSGTPVWDFWLVRGSDLRFAARMSLGLLRRALRVSAGGA